MLHKIHNFINHTVFVTFVLESTYLELELYSEQSEMCYIFNRQKGKTFSYRCVQNNSGQLFAAWHGALKNIIKLQINALISQSKNIQKLYKCYKKAHYDMHNQ